jgi:peptidoglycan hydrolase-like protein with peptidoglycan-binding domain
MHAIPARLRRPSRRSRPAIALIAAAAAFLLATTSVSAALPGFGWPTQSLGNRGVDVRAIQSLLRGRGIAAVYDGVFTADTVRAVSELQAARGLPVTGVVDPLTWPHLIQAVGPGAPREPVLTAQRLLNEKFGARLVATGTWDEPTRQAVVAFDRHVGLANDGRVDYFTWRHLVAHFDLPRFSSAGLCDYSVGNGPANWGTGAAIGQLEAAGARMVGLGYGRLPVGDVSLEHPGDIAGHMTHERGLDVDLRPIRDNRDQCRWGTNYRFASYDRTATRALVRSIRATAPGHVKLIYFNDPVLIREGLTTWYTGHDDHLHVRYCEASHPVAAYRC